MTRCHGGTLGTWRSCRMTFAGLKNGIKDNKDGRYRHICHFRRVLQLEYIYGPKDHEGITDQQQARTDDRKAISK